VGPPSGAPGSCASSGERRPVPRGAYTADPTAGLPAAGFTLRSDPLGAVADTLDETVADSVASAPGGACTEAPLDRSDGSRQQQAKPHAPFFCSLDPCGPLGEGLYGR